MNADWLDRYCAAWVHHAHASVPGTGDPLLKTLLSFMADDVRYEDVPTNLVFVGHAAIRDMGAAALQMAADMHFTILSRQISGNQYAFETEARGTNTGALGKFPATNKPFVLRAASIGMLSPDGKVAVHRDYWDLAGFLTQIGLFPAS